MDGSSGWIQIQGAGTGEFAGLTSICAASESLIAASAIEISSNFLSKGAFFYSEALLFDTDPCS